MILQNHQTQDSETREGQEEHSIKTKKSVSALSCVQCDSVYTDTTRDLTTVFLKKEYTMVVPSSFFVTLSVT